MVAPHAHITGATVGDRAFIATRASLFPGSSVGTGSEVRINGVVDVNSTRSLEAVVPIGVGCRRPCKYLHSRTP